MTKEELYKVSDILNDVLSNYLRGSETEEVLSRFEESISKSDMLQEKCNITGIKSRHATGKLKECIDNQTEEGLEQARKQLEENPQECMYARDNYTDEDRKVLCDGCEEKCEYAQKEADWLQELHCKLDSLSKEDFEKVWARYRQKEEPISEDLEEAASEYLKQNYDIDNIYEEDDLSIRNTFKAGAKWQMEKDYKDGLENDNFLTFAYMDGLEKGKQEMEKQIIKEAVECTIEGVIGCDSLLRIKGRYKYGDKVKVIIIKDQ